MKNSCLSFVFFRNYKILISGYFSQYILTKEGARTIELERLEIPTNKIEQLKKKGFNTVEDLAEFYPRRYKDFRTVVPLNKLMEHCNTGISVIGEIVSTRRGASWVQALVKDATGSTISIVWFNQNYIESKLCRGRQYVFSGEVRYDAEYQSFSMVSPHSFSCNPEEISLISPVYSDVKGMSSEYLASCIEKAISLIIASKDECDFIENPVLKRLGVPSMKQFLPLVHAPKNDEDIALAERRIAVNTLFPFVMKMAQKQYEYVAKSPFYAGPTKDLDAFINSLSFKLTDDQETAIRQVLEKMKTGKRVDSLIQGDVGCGKTVIITAISMVMAKLSYQTVIMCPTTVLAEQHYSKIKKQLAQFGIEVVLLVSGLSAKEKKEILKSIRSNKAKVIIGTNAVIASDVIYSKLALTVVDEEHRFGVEQRELLQQKAAEGVHNISMTATPIPRTIASTVYGSNIEVINVRTMPVGRKPIQTIIYSNEEKVYESIYRQIKDGHQCYVVCPLIETSDKAMFDDVDSVEATYDKMVKWFAQYPEVKIGAIAGNMKASAINEKILEFSSGKSHIIISTTIIEVGIDVPNATVIVVKNAERFGLAQLHQLRGRVGRGNAQSYCVLLSQKKENPRLIAMTQTSDGFEIAKIDLDLRGTGDIVGTKQSGLDKCITLMIQNKELYEALREEVTAIYIGKIRYDKYAQHFL